MADVWDQFPDAPVSAPARGAAPAAPAAQADPFADFPDAPQQQQQVEQGPQVLASADQPDTWGNAVKNVSQGALSIATGAVATPVSGLAGLVSAPFVGADKAADITNKWASALTFQPRTERGQGVVEGITYPLRKLSDAAKAVAGPIAEGNDGQPRFRGPMQAEAMRKWEAAGRPAAEGSPLLATAIDTALQSAPAVLLRGRSPAAKPAVAEKPVIDPRAQIMADAQKAGLKFTPTQAGAKAGSIAEGLAGQAKLERSLSLENAPVVNKLAAKDLGLPDDAVLTPARINELKAKANQAYSDVAKTGKRVVSDEYRAEIKAIGDRTGGESFKGDVPKDITQLKDFYSKVTTFTAKDAVSKIRQLRSEATANIKARNAPEQNAKGYVQREIADALDNELARHVESLGKADLVAKYQAARVQLAKVHSVEDALSGGNVSAKSLAQQLKRGVPLSGNLRLVAQTYGEFEKVLQNVNKIRDGNPFGVVDAFVGIAGAANSPPLVAAVLARPAVRGILASDRYQRGLAKQGARAPEAPAPTNKLAAPAAANALSSDQRRRATR